MPFELRKRPFLIRTHKSRIARRIGGENGGQPAFDAFRGKSGAPNRMGRIDYRLSEAILMVNASGGSSFSGNGAFSLSSIRTVDRLRPSY